MHEAFIRYPFELPYTLAVTGNSYVTSSSETINRQRLDKQSRARQYQGTVQLKTLMSFGNTAKDAFVDSVPKSDSKMRITPIKLRPETRELIKEPKENHKVLTNSAQKTITKRFDQNQSVIHPYSYPYFQSTRLGSRSSENEKLHESDLANRKASNSRVQSEREAAEERILLKKLFTNEKIQASGKFKITTLEPVAPNKKDPNGFSNKIRKVSNANVQRKTPEPNLLTSRPSFNFQNYRLFEESFTKINMSHKTGRNSTEPSEIDLSREVITRREPPVKEGTVIERLMRASRRGHRLVTQRSGELKDEKSSYGNRNSRVSTSREGVSILNTSRVTIERKPSSENNQAHHLYLRSKSNGNMIRLLNGVIPPGILPEPVAGDVLPDLLEKTDDKYFSNSSAVKSGLDQSVLTNPPGIVN